MRKLKSLVCVLFAIFAASSLFAAGYKVESFTGKVTYESAPGKWTAVEQGQELSASTVIQTSVNSSLILTLDGAKINIKAMQKGTIESLASATSGNTGIKKGSSLKGSGVAAGSDKTSKSVVTASSRASEAKEDYEWDE
jgi:hypothetical protein